VVTEVPGSTGQLGQSPTEVEKAPRSLAHSTIAGRVLALMGLIVALTGLNVALTGLNVALMGLNVAFPGFRCGTVRGPVGFGMKRRPEHCLCTL